MRRYRGTVTFSTACVITAVLTRIILNAESAVLTTPLWLETASIIAIIAPVSWLLLYVLGFEVLLLAIFLVAVWLSQPMSLCALLCIPILRWLGGRSGVISEALRETLRTVFVGFALLSSAAFVLNVYVFLSPPALLGRHVALVRTYDLLKSVADRLKAIAVPSGIVLVVLVVLLFVFGPRLARWDLLERYRALRQWATRGYVVALVLTTFSLLAPLPLASTADNATHVIVARIVTLQTRKEALQSEYLAAVWLHESASAWTSIEVGAYRRMLWGLERQASWSSDNASIMSRDDMRFGERLARIEGKGMVERIAVEPRPRRGQGSSTSESVEPRPLRGIGTLRYTRGKLATDLRRSAELVERWELARNAALGAAKDMFGSTLASAIPGGEGLGRAFAEEVVERSADEFFDDIVKLDTPQAGLHGVEYRVLAYELTEQWNLVVIDEAEAVPTFDLKFLNMKMERIQDRVKAIEREKFEERIREGER
jgi:hypothetical protein